MTKKVLQTRASKASHSSHSQEIKKHRTPEQDPVDAVAKFAAYAKSEGTESRREKGGVIEPLRFSELDNLERGNRSNVIRVFAFLVVVVALGVGLILFIENVNRSAANSAANSSSSTSSVAAIPGYSLATTILTDDEASNVAKKEDFATSNLSLGSAANQVDDVEVMQVNYLAYTSLARVEWELSSAVNGFPATSVTYLTDTDAIEIKFAGIQLSDATMERTVEAPVGIVSSISATQTAEGVTFNVQLIEGGKYFASLSTAQAKLTLDIKTETQLTATSTSSSSSTTSSSEASVSSSTSSAASSSTSSSSAAVGELLDNPYSRGPQKVSCGLTNEDLYMRNYYFQDYGPYFEFNWAFRGTTTASVPKLVEATLINEEGQNYLEVVIEGVETDLFQAQSWPTANLGSVNLTYSNVTAVQFKGREGKTSTYRLVLRRAADFKLYATKTRGDLRLLTVEVKD